MPQGYKGLKIFHGNASKQLANGIAESLGTTLASCTVSKFINGETNVIIGETVRDFDCFIIQNTSSTNPNDSVMEVLILCDALKRASAKRITVVIPCFAYARQDKKDKSRAPITAKLVANLLQTAGADRLITMDLHASQIQGFFDIPVDNLYGEKLLTRWIKDNLKGDFIVVSPDAGGVKRAKSFSDNLGCDLAIIHKERKKANEVENMTLVGDVSKKVALLVDDLSDTCGTLCLAAETLKKSGATQVYAFTTHGVLSGNATEKLEKSSIQKLVITDSIELSETKSKCSKVQVVTISGILAETIRRTHNGESISFIF